MRGTFRKIAATLAITGITLVVPMAAPAQAADPVQVQLTLEGCKLPTLALSCAYPADFTTGSLGKNWAELDLVPHRLTLANSGPAQTFDIRLSADHVKGGVTGYDYITTPVAAGTCTVTVLAQNVVSPSGVIGGVDTVLTTLLRVQLPLAGICTISYSERLAIGSHLYSGASLQSQVLNADYSSSGQRTVSIPVNEIDPQTIAKTATAYTTPDYTWTISKTGSTESLTLDSCLPAPTEPNIGYTVVYTRTKVDGVSQTVSGTITLTNPANRALTATITDTIKRDGTPVGGGTLPAVTVGADSTATVPYSFGIAAGSGTLSNTASAVYADPDIPGATLAPLATTVAVPVSLVELPGTNPTATITDTETASSGLVYSRTSPQPTAGFVATDSFDVNVTGSGNFAVSKIVKAAAPGNFSGTLTNAVSLDPSGDGTPLTASVQIPITVVAAAPTLTVDKYVDVAPANDTDFTFTVTNDQTAATTPVTVTIAAGQSSGSTTVTVAPSTAGYTVAEGTPPAGYDSAEPVGAGALGLCGSGSVRVDDLRSRADLSVTKTVAGDDAPPAGFVFAVTCTDGTTATLTFTGSGTQTVPGIQTGSVCTVTETPAPGWTSAPSGPQEVTITDEGASVSFTNTRNVGSLAVTKTVVGDEAPAAGFTFTVTCSDGTAETLTFTGNGQQVVGGILSGSTCTVTETAAPGWTSSPSGPQEIVLDLADGAVATVPFTNTRNLASVAVTKAILGDEAPAAGFTFTVVCSDGTAETLTFTEGGSQLVGGILSGSTCTVTETPAEGWESIPSGPQEIVLDLADGAVGTVAFANIRQPAGLQVVKTVDLEAAEYGDTLTYGLTVTNIEARPLHAVEVSDDVPDGTTYVAGSATCPAPCAASYDAATDTVHFAVGDLAPGASFGGMTFQVTIDQPAAAPGGAIPGRTIFNTAVASSLPDVDPVPSNEVKTTIVAVLGVKVVRRPPAVLPHTGSATAATTGLALALMLSGAGLTVVTRRRTAPIG